MATNKQLLNEIARFQAIAGLRPINSLNEDNYEEGVEMEEDMGKENGGMHTMPNGSMMKNSMMKKEDMGMDDEGMESKDRAQILSKVEDEYGISDAVQQFCGWSEEEAEGADGTNWDDVVDAIMMDPDMKAQFID